MTRLRLLLSWLAVCAVAAFTLSGCAAGPTYTEPPLPPIRADTLGRLRVDGPNAFINGIRVPTGSYVVDGDTVSTRGNTSALVVLNDGGEIQLDADTDPLIRQGVCLILKIGKGRVALRNHLRCYEFDAPSSVAATMGSFVNIEARDDATRVTVITGQVSMRSPTQATLGPDMQYVARPDGTAQVLQLTPEQAYATIAWTRNYFRPRAGQGSGGMSSAQASLVGGVIGLLVDQIFKRDRRRSRPEILPPGGSQDNPQPRTPDIPDERQRNATGQQGNQPPPIPGVDQRDPANR